jgi:4-hydroxybenzoate polyprenyltransferase
MRIPALLRALQPRQWSKNVFVLAALFFASGDQAVADPITRGDVQRTLLAFVAFCLASSSVYLFNGVQDAASDRAHPVKRSRPIASGELSPGVALGSALLLLALSLALGWSIGAPAGGWLGVGHVLAIYVLVNVAYSLRLKHVVLVDAFCIASGFVLRVEAGGIAAGASISKWLFLCTLFLALFLALNKRRAEIALLGEESGAHRANLREYTPAFLDQMVGVLAACTLVCYTMYTVDAETAAKFGAQNRLFWTVPFVAFGLGRYMLLVQANRGGGDPSRVFLGEDVPFLVNTLAWAACVAWAIYG